MVPVPENDKQSLLYSDEQILNQEDKYRRTFSTFLSIRLNNYWKYFKINEI